MDRFLVKFAPKTPAKSADFSKKFVPKNPAKFDFFFRDLSGALTCTVQEEA